MKSKILLFSLVALGITPVVTAETHTISNSGTTFTPNAITIVVGDVIDFDIGSSHNAVEVSEETWNANGSTSNGGFSVPFGGGEVTFDEPGVFYFVCEPHAGLGMKGTITVETATSLTDATSEVFPELNVYPNPARGSMTISFSLRQTSNVSLAMYDITGKEVINLSENIFQAGEYEEKINLEGIAQGRYVIYFKAEDEVKVVSVSILE